MGTNKPSRPGELDVLLTCLFVLNMLFEYLVHKICTDDPLGILLEEAMENTPEARTLETESCF
jgi:hypothetical protein